MNVFPAAETLESAALDVLASLTETCERNAFILVKTDRLIKMTRFIWLWNTTPATVVFAFLKYYVYPYGVPRYILIDIEKQLVPKFFDSVCVLLGSRNYLTIAYCPQTNVQTERLVSTVRQRLQHYVAAQKKSWDQYLQLLAHSYCMRSSNNGDEIFRASADALSVQHHPTQKVGPTW